MYVVILSKKSSLTLLLDDKYALGIDVQVLLFKDNCIKCGGGGVKILN